MSERIDVLKVDWDHDAVFDVSREVVSEILVNSWGRDSNWLEVNRQIKSAFDLQKDVTIRDATSTVFVGFRPPRNLVVEGFEQAEFPSVSVHMIPIADNELRFLHWQRLKEISDLMRGMSPYYNLAMPSELQLSFPVNVYARSSEVMQAVLI